jgi:hypothetical protein
MIFYNIRFYQNKEGFIVFDNAFSKLEAKEVVLIRFKFYSKTMASLVIYSACGLIHEFPIKLSFAKNYYSKSNQNLPFKEIKYLLSKEIKRNPNCEKQFFTLYQFCEKHKIDFKFYMSNQEWKKIE